MLIKLHVKMIWEFRKGLDQGKKEKYDESKWRREKKGISSRKKGKKNRVKIVCVLRGRGREITQELK